MEQTPTSKPRYAWSKYHDKQKLAAIMFVAERKEAGCSRCPEKDTEKLRFCHKVGVATEGRRSIARMCHDHYAVSAIAAELEDCELLCQACHYQEMRTRRRGVRPNRLTEKERQRILAVLNDLVLSAPPELLTGQLRADLDAALVSLGATPVVELF